MVRSDHCIVVIFLHYIRYMIAAEFTVSVYRPTLRFKPVHCLCNTYVELVVYKIHLT